MILMFPIAIIEGLWLQSNGGFISEDLILIEDAEICDLVTIMERVRYFNVPITMRPRLGQRSFFKLVFDDIEEFEMIYVIRNLDVTFFFV